jgi:hypothetical protein
MQTDAQRIAQLEEALAREHARVVKLERRIFELEHGNRTTRRTDAPLPRYDERGRRINT